MKELDTIEIKAGTKLRFPKVDKTGTVIGVSLVRALTQWATEVRIDLTNSDGTVKSVSVYGETLAKYFRDGEAEIVND